MDVSASAADATATRRAEQHVLRLLRQRHDALRARAEQLDEGALTDPSYCTEWSLAQVYSHLGSGAVIGTRVLESARRGMDPPDPWEVWNVWDALPPSDMVARFEPADEAYLTALQQAVESGEPSLVPIDGRPWPLLMAMTARLVEVALHLWDIQVSQDPEAEVDADAAAWILATFPLDIAAQGLHPATVSALAPLRVMIRVAEPASSLLLELAPTGATFRAAGGEDPADVVVDLPHAASCVRLIAGRWRRGIDDARAVVVGDLDVSLLPILFRGF